MIFIILLGKKKKINKKIKIVCVSDWLAKKVKESYLFNKFEVHTIPPCINIKKWKNIEKTLLGVYLVDLNEKIIIFLSANGTSEKRKGFDLLLKALDNEHFKKDNYRLVIIGKINDQDKNKIPINYTNYLLNTTDDELILDYYIPLPI